MPQSVSCHEVVLCGIYKLALHLETFSGDYFSCDMERDNRNDGSCQIRQDTGDSFDFTWRQGRTPTGSSFDRRFEDGSRYVYDEVQETHVAWGNWNGSSASITTECHPNQTASAFRLLMLLCLVCHRYPVTGPERAQTGNYYLYIEASGRRNNEVARYVYT